MQNPLLFYSLRDLPILLPYPRPRPTCLVRVYVIHDDSPTLCHDQNDPVHEHLGDGQTLVPVSLFRDDQSLGPPCDCRCVCHFLDLVPSHLDRYVSCLEYVETKFVHDVPLEDGHDETL